MAQTTTFSDLKDFAERRNRDDPTFKGTDYIEEAIQDALRNLSQVQDWTWLQDRTRITTEDDDNTGTISINTGDSQITGVGTLFSTLGVDSTWTLKLAGENVDYEVKSTIQGQLSLALASPYVGSANLSAAAYRVFKRSYDLPARVREITKVIDARNPQNRLDRVSHETMLVDNLSRSDGGEPRVYSIENKTADSVRQLWLYPFPDDVFQYDLIFQRHPTIPTANADVIDWPDDSIHILKSAIEVELALKAQDQEWLSMALVEYQRKLDNVMDGDIQDSSSSYFIGTPVRGGRSIFKTGLDFTASDLSS